MPQLLNCPHCGKQIEDDSTFCDQCGAGLYKCPQCGLFLKGNYCPSCGVQTVKAGSASQKPVKPDQQPPDQETVQKPVQPPVQKPDQSNRKPPIQPPVYTTDPGNIPGNNPGTGTSISGVPAVIPGRLSCRTLGIILSLANGAIIGRLNGNYVAQLSTLNFISGTHGRVDFNGVSWTFTDLGSTNGTTINNIPCAPHNPVPFKIGDLIRIGKTYDFYVE